MRSLCDSSRCNNDLLAERLIEERGGCADEAEFLATYSQGRPGIAIGLIGNTEFQSKRDIVALVAKAAAAGNPWSALRLAETLRSGEAIETEAPEEEEAAPSQTRSAAARKGVRDTAIEALDMLLVWYRDLLAVKTQGEDAPIVNADRRSEIAQQAMRYAGPDSLLARLEAILYTKRRIQGNAIPQIATEALMMQLCS